MKRLFLIPAVLMLLVAFGANASAQSSLTMYVDTTLAGQVHATNAASAAAIARGFTGYTLLRSDANDFNERYIQIRFRGKASATGAAATSFTADTARIQGLLVKKTDGNKMDSVWVNIPIPIKIAGIDVAAGVAVQRDTIVYHLTPGRVGDVKGYISDPIPLTPFYHAYRVVNGVCDSGRVVIREIWKPRR